MPIANEKILLRQIAENDEKAFALIIDGYWNNIFSQALAYLKSKDHAQDIVQDVFLKVWEKRSTLPAIERFDSFLFILARNQIISELRKKLASPINDFIIENCRELAYSPDEELSAKQFQELINRSIDLLPPQQKTAFLLSRNEGLTYEEIAVKMQLSRETVKKHIFRALNFLRTQLKTHAEMLASIFFIHFF